MSNGSASYVVQNAYPYALTSNNHLTLCKATSSGHDDFQTIIDFAAKITAEVRSENGELRFVVEGVTKDGRSFTLDISAQEFADDRTLKAKLLAEAGHRAVVSAGMLKHLGPAIQRLTPEGVKDLRRYDRTGWADGRFLMPGRVPEGIKVVLDEKQPYRIDPSADIARGLEALGGLIHAFPPERSTVALTPVFQAPLAKPMGWRGERSAEFIVGLSGSLKTSWAMVLMCLYGKAFIEESTLIKLGEGSTRNAVMARATCCHDMPMLIDNYKPSTGGGARDLVNLIHNIVEGGEKERLSRSAALRENRPVYCWPIVTGEDVPDRDQASLARMVIVRFPGPATAVNQPLRTAQRLSAHLCAVGHAWLSWLESDDARKIIDDTRQLFPGLQEAWVNRLHRRSRTAANILRMATNLATQEATWVVMTFHPTLGALAKAYQEVHRRGLEDVANEMLQMTTEAIDARRYLVILRELLTTGRAILLPLQDKPTRGEEDRVIGWQDPDGSVYLLPSVARAVVGKFLGNDNLGKLTPHSLYAQLERQGNVASRDKEQVPIPKIVGGKKQRVLHLKASALTEEGDHGN